MTEFRRFARRAQSGRIHRHKAQENFHWAPLRAKHQFVEQFPQIWCDALANGYNARIDPFRVLPILANGFAADASGALTATKSADARDPAPLLVPSAPK
jgi:hypothetical protein